MDARETRRQAQDRRAVVWLKKDRMSVLRAYVIAPGGKQDDTITELSTIAAHQTSLMDNNIQNPLLYLDESPETL